MVELFFGDVRSLAIGDGTESVLNLFRALNVLRFFADHERHVFLERDVTITIRIDDIYKNAKVRICSKEEKQNLVFRPYRRWSQIQDRFDPLQPWVDRIPRHGGRI